MTTPPADAPPADPPVDPPAGDPPADPPANNGGRVTFTADQQAHIDKLIEKAHGKAKGQAEKEFKAWLDTQALSETERAQAEAQASAKLVEETKREALVARIEVAAERAALAAGVKPDRVTKFLRLVDLDLDKLTDDGKPDGDAIKALVDAEAKANPEFLAGSNGAGAGASGGEFNGAGDKHIFTRAEIQKMSVEDYEKNEAEIDRQRKAGLIK